MTPAPTPTTLAVIKDIAAIAGVILSPLIGALTAVWVYRRQLKERLSAAVIWRWGQDHLSGQQDEFPNLAVQNRSERPVVVTDFRFLQGVLWRSPQATTAMDYADPTDVNFPYVIEPGKLLHFRLDSSAARALLEERTALRRLLRRLGRPALTVEIVTMSGVRVRANAEKAVEWKHRPEWLRG
jgi:hypothetical protein